MKLNFHLRVKIFNGILKMLIFLELLLINNQLFKFESSFIEYFRSN